MVWINFVYSRVTVNKTSDLENNTDTLKKLTDKPNNQLKLATVGGTPLPPGQMKCNILKGIHIIQLLDTHYYF